MEVNYVKSNLKIIHQAKDPRLELLSLVKTILLEIDDHKETVS